MAGSMNSSINKLFLIVILIGNTSCLWAADNMELWKALRSGGHVALLRHALAPGTSDPPEFTIGDCSTQRNLSDTGREQAKRIGERLRAHGVEQALVFSSQWCRCIETAELIGFGMVKQLPVLNSFYEQPERGAEQTRSLTAWLAKQSLLTPLVLVTHQVNITALTGVFPASGELVVIRPSAAGEVQVLGSVETE